MLGHLPRVHYFPLNFSSKTSFKTMMIRFHLIMILLSGVGTSEIGNEEESETTLVSCREMTRRSADSTTSCTEFTADTELGETVLPMAWLNMSCDSTTDGGQWIVVQRNANNTEKGFFNRTFEDFKNGFGCPLGSFWWGLEKLHCLTSAGAYELRVDIILDQVDSKKVVITADSFQVQSEAQNYRILMSGFSETDETGFYDQNGMAFTTQDKDSDFSENENCAVKNGGGWWYSDCTSLVLNGDLGKIGEEEPVVNNGCSLLSSRYLSVEMKVRQKKTTESGICNIRKKRSTPQQNRPTLCTDTTPNLGVCPRIPLDSLSSALCDNQHEKAGWMVFQRRVNDSVDFYRDWSEYRAGFGNPQNGGSFWWGLEKLYQLTSSGRYELMVEIAYMNGNKETKEVVTASSFRVKNETEFYQLEMSGYSGAKNTGLDYQNGNKFSTKDKDNDRSQSEHCAQKYHGGWWYNHCHQGNLNGIYDSNDSRIKGETDPVFWLSWLSADQTGFWEPTFVEMKVRPADFCKKNID